MGPNLLVSEPRRTLGDCQFPSLPASVPFLAPLTCIQVGSWELGSQQYTASPSSCLAGHTVRNAMDARCCQPRASLKGCSVSRWHGMLIILH